MQPTKNRNSLILQLLLVLGISLFGNGCSFFDSRKVNDLEVFVIQELVLKDVYNSISTSYRSLNESGAPLLDYSPDEYTNWKQLALDSKNKLTETPKEEHKALHSALELYLNQVLERDSFILLHYPISPFFGPHLNSPKEITYYNIDSKNQIISYLNLLNQFDQQFGSLVDALELRRKQGLIMPKLLIDQVIIQCDSVTMQPPKESLLYLHLKLALDEIGIIEPSIKQGYLDDCLNSLNESVYPSFVRLSAYLKQLERNAVNVSGVWQYANGEKYYQYCVKLQSGYDKDVESLYQIGKIELSRIEGEMTILKQLGVLEKTENASLQDSTPRLNLRQTLANYLCNDEVGYGYELFVEMCIQKEHGTVSLATLEKQQLALVKMLTDVGIHHKKWLRNQALEYVQNHSSLSELDALKLVDKSIALPGYNTSRAITYLKLLELETDGSLEWKSLKDDLEKNGIRPLQLVLEGLSF